ncbi:trypsin-like peptidase domain-containing protein [Brevundimonas sp.]|uniref:trypsin-like peptidase domain-containing protein n=1 Tax=Brevundimonas sp. TaxID=1871086 RepID=UPI002737FF6E|nr:trypsin-like peptidase domain-containing protein [Brevundimonas sp.]MDP3803165.1 trypsin-like peptidase domain-containing protein [Brevundimonas sp.]
MMKRKEFMLGAIAGLTFAAAATAGGVIDWPSAQAGPVAGVSGRLAPSAGAAGLAFAPPQGAPLSFADIFQQVAPAVVQIDVKTRVQARQGFIQIPGLGAVPVPVPEGEEGEEGEGGATALGAGSGFFISADGFIVTNNHVVADALEITVKLADGREMEARVVGRDESTDLAVIKVDGSDFPFVTFEETAKPRVGDWVIAVGNPFGLGGTATAGIVSAEGRGEVDNSTPYTDYLQIDAAINRGNSGGPTFDIYGRVIGVNSAIYSPTGNSVGIGFAIPATIAKPITDQLMRGETIERGYLGVEIGNLAPFRESMGLPENTRGALINSVTPGGPADRSGLQAGDIVTAMNGTAITSSSELTRRVGQARSGDTLRLEILRDGRRQTVNVRSGTRPSLAELNADRNGPDELETPAPAAASAAVAGLNVAPLSAALRQRYEVPANINGVVVTQAGRGPTQGFQPGYVVFRAGNAPVTSVADLQAAVRAARAAGRDSLFLMIWTPRGNVPFPLELPESE